MILIGRWLYSHDPRPEYGEYFVARETSGFFDIKDRLGILRTGTMIRVDMDLLAMSREQLLKTIMELRNAK